MDAETLGFAASWPWAERTGRAGRSFTEPIIATLETRDAARHSLAESPAELANLFEPEEFAASSVAYGANFAIPMSLPPAATSAPVPRLTVPSCPNP